MNSEPRLTVPLLRSAMRYCIPACRGISQEGSGGEDNPHVSRDAGPVPELLSLGVTSCIPRRTIRSPSPNKLLTETEHGSTGAKTQLIAQRGPAHPPHLGLTRRETWGKQNPSH